MTDFIGRRATCAAIGMAIVCVLACTSVHSQQPSPTNRLITPPSAIRDNHYGSLTLMLLIGADGSVHDARIEKSSGYRDLDDSAISQVRKWHYTPLRKNGVPSESYARVPINFNRPVIRIDDKGWRLNCAKPGEAPQYEHVLQPGCTVDDDFTGADHGKRIRADLPPSWQEASAISTPYSNLHIDKASAMRIDNTIHIWAMETIGQPRVVGEKSYATRIQEMSFDCSQRTFLPMVSWYYADDGTPGPAAGNEDAFTPSPELSRQMHALCTS